MRVVLVTPIRFLGGGEHFMLCLARGLDECGHEATIVCRPDAAIGHQASRLQLPVATARLRGELDPCGVLQLRRIIRRHRPEVALVNMEKAVRLLAAARTGCRLPIVRRLGMCLPFPPAWRFRWTYRKLVAHLVVNAEATRRLLERHNPWIDPTRVSVIPNAVDTTTLTRVDRARARSALRARFGFAGTRPVIMTVARLEPQKRPEVLLEALRLLGDEAPEAVWLGAGSRATPLREAARQANVRLELPGYCAEPAELLAGADLLVHPSEAEGMPHAVLEAMALGVPVLASDVDGVRELLAEDRGRRVPVGQPAALAAAIRAALADASWRTRVIEAARQHVLAHHDLPAMIERYVTLLDSVSAAGKR